MQQMIDDDLTYGVEITNGTYYDTGDKLEYLKRWLIFKVILTGDTRRPSGDSPKIMAGIK